MTTSNRREATTEQLLMEEFIKELETTTEQVHQLLQDLQNSKVDFAGIKAELNFLVDNFKELSKIIRDGDGSGSILTRLALLENSVEEIKQYVNKDVESDAQIVTRLALLEQRVESMLEKASDSTKKKSEQDNTATAGRWKLYVTIATGVFTLLATLLALLAEAC